MSSAMQVQPYLFFEGRCEEAVEFYRRALGAEVTELMRSKDSPDPAMTRPAWRYTWRRRDSRSFIRSWRSAAT